MKRDLYEAGRTGKPVRDVPETSENEPSEQNLSMAFCKGPLLPDQFVRPRRKHLWAISHVFVREGRLLFATTPLWLR